jgi:hypothetical protein
MTTLGGPPGDTYDKWIKMVYLHQRLTNKEGLYTIVPLKDFTLSDCRKLF